ncbi:MAG: filamentous hemagglutinin N-terminal domain-containing protein, partial [Bacillota bacterium]
MKISRRIRRNWLRQIPEWMRCFCRSVSRKARQASLWAQEKKQRIKKYVQGACKAANDGIARCSDSFNALLNGTITAHTKEWVAAALAAGLIAAPYTVNDGGWQLAAVNAAPEGGAVVGGSATIQTQAETTNITQTSQRAAIDWSSFDIAKTETVNFLQPSSDAALLNRIVSGGASQIFGNLNANGHIYIVNPNGINVGATANINANGLYLSTANVDPADLVTSGWQLAAGGNGNANIVMSGNINAGSVVVINNAKQADIAGKIIVPSGTVTINKIDNINLNGTIDVSASPVQDSELRTQNSNNGGSVTIFADKTADVTGARIFARGGSVSGDGGFIETSGEEVHGLGTLTVDASAVNGQGGTWLLDPTYTTIDGTNVATFNNALNGGTSITNAAADITVLASVFKTSGSRATISLVATGGNITFGSDVWWNCYSTTPDGTFGTMDVSLSATGNVKLHEFELGQNIVAGVPYGTLTVISSGGNILDYSDNARIMAATGIFSASAGTVTLNSTANRVNLLQVTATTASFVNNIAVTLGAANVSGAYTIAVGGAVTQSGALTAGTATINASTSDVTLTNVGNDFNTLSLTGGNVTVIDKDEISLGASRLTNFTLTAGGAVTQSAAITAGSVTINAGSNDITLNGYNNSISWLSLIGRTALVKNISNFEFWGSRLTTLGLTASGSVTGYGNHTIGTATIIAGGGIAFSDSGFATDPDNDFGVLSLTGTAASIYDISGVTLGVGNLSSTLYLTANGNVSQSGALTAGAVTITTGGSGAGIDLDAYANTLTGGATYNFSGSGSHDASVYNVSSTGSAFAIATLSGSLGTLTINTPNAARVLGGTRMTSMAALNVTAGGAVTQSAAITVGWATINAGSNDITLNGYNNSIGAMQLYGRTALIKDISPVVFWGASLTTLGLTASGSVTGNGNHTIGTASINAGGAIAFSDDGGGGNPDNDFGVLSLTGTAASI